MNSTTPPRTDQEDIAHIGDSSQTGCVRVYGSGACSSHVHHRHTGARHQTEGRGQAHTWQPMHGILEEVSYCPTRASIWCAISQPKQTKNSYDIDNCHACCIPTDNCLCRSDRPYRTQPELQLRQPAQPAPRTVAWRQRPHPQHGAASRRCLPSTKWLIPINALRPGSSSKGPTISTLRLKVLGWRPRPL